MPVTTPGSIQFPDQLGSTASAARELRALRESEATTRLIAMAAIVMGVAGIGLAVATWTRSLRGVSSSAARSRR